MYTSMPKTALLALCAAACSAALQSAAACLPVVGLPLSLLSTLPVLAAALYSVQCGWLTFFCAGAALFVACPGQTAVFLCAHGAFGLTLGVCLRRSPAFAVALSAGELLAGLLALIYLFRSYPYSVLGDSLPLYLLFILLVIFSISYAMLWALIGGRLMGMRLPNR